VSYVQTLLPSAPLLLSSEYSPSMGGGESAMSAMECLLHVTMWVVKKTHQDTLPRWPMGHKHDVTRPRSKGEGVLQYSNARPGRPEQQCTTVSHCSLQHTHTPMHLLCSLAVAHKTSAKDLSYSFLFLICLIPCYPDLIQLHAQTNPTPSFY
jgi:hypothetical protein